MSQSWRVENVVGTGRHPVDPMARGILCISCCRRVDSPSAYRRGDRSRLPFHDRAEGWRITDHTLRRQRDPSCAENKAETASAHPSCKLEGLPGLGEG